MSKNIVVVTGSPRVNGNSEMLADAFIEGARESGNTVTKFNAGKMNVKGCIACKYCFSHDGECVQKDDMQEILKVLRQTDMIVLASPIYWFGFSAQLKAVIDRFYAGQSRGFPIESAALLLTYADTDEATAEATILNYKAVISYLKWEDKGIIAQADVSARGEIAGKESLDEARRLGKSIN